MPYQNCVTMTQENCILAVDQNHVSGLTCCQFNQCVGVIEDYFLPGERRNEVMFCLEITLTRLLWSVSSLLWHLSTSVDSLLPTTPTQGT